jgi:hypothetical protein
MSFETDFRQLKQPIECRARLIVDLRAKQAAYDAPTLTREVGQSQRWLSIQIRLLDLLRSSID